jgi:hypothetical protein
MRVLPCFHSGDNDGPQADLLIREANSSIEKGSESTRNFAVGTHSSGVGQAPRFFLLGKALNPAFSPLRPRLVRGLFLP